MPPSRRQRRAQTSRKSSFIPPPVFPLLVSATRRHDAPEEEPSAPAPDGQPNMDPIDATTLRDRIDRVAPSFGACLDYSKLNKVNEYLTLSRHEYYPIEGRAAQMGADPRLTSWLEVHRIAGM